MILILILMVFIYGWLLKNLFNYFKNHKEIIKKDISKDFKLHMN